MVDAKCKSFALSSPSSVGLFSFNLVETLFGSGILSSNIYMLVGLAGILNILLLFNDFDDKFIFLEKYLTEN